MDLTTLARGQRTAGRLAQIVTILCKYSLADWLKAVNVRPVRKFLTSFDGQPIAGLPTEVRIRMALTEMGTTFIKLGQILSTRPDLVGPALADELTSLQDDTPADPPETARTLIEAELHKPIKELFAEFEDVAFASASIGQVHRARLRDGQQVVVKVLHHNIEDKVATDLDIMMALSEIGEKYSAELRHYRPHATMMEFRRTLLRELDFRRELRNIQEFIHNFQGDATVRFPAPHPSLSSQRVLTLDYLDGISIGDTERLKEEGHDLRTIARRGANIILGMIFRDGFYHADPHPGNLLVLPRTVIGVLDCGMVGRLDDHTRDAFTTMLLAAINKDSNQFTGMVTRLARVPADLDRDAFEAEIHDFLADYGTQSLNQFDVSGALNGITDIIRRYHLLLPANLAPLLKAMIVLEGTSRQLDRSFSLAEMIRPYYVRVVQEKLSPRRIFRHWRRMFMEWDHLMRTLPGDVGDILDRTKRGQFKFHLEHRRLETSVALLVDGLLSASLFLGSTLMLCHRVLAEPFFDLSIPGVLGLPCSLFLVWRALRATKKTRSEP
ncbi:MAG TPA: AarF/UbiB family protein [Gemmataceae bacterium]|nr:AarF/UbiB family protein [Gemmataceae bacterium]